MSTIDSLLVTIDASTELLRRELEKGNQAIGGFADKTHRQLGGIGDAFQRLGGMLRTSLAAFGISLGVRELVDFVKSAIEGTVAIGNAAQAAGMASERFQKLQQSFAEGGVSSEEFAIGMAHMAKAFGEFQLTGAGPAAEAIKRLGLNWDVANGNIKTSDQFLQAVVSRLSLYKGTVEATALSQEIFGKGSRAFVNILTDGVPKMNEAAAAVETLFTDEEIERARKINAEYEHLTTTIGVNLKKAVLSVIDVWGEMSAAINASSPASAAPVPWGWDLLKGMPFAPRGGMVTGGGFGGETDGAEGPGGPAGAGKQKPPRSTMPTLTGRPNPGDVPAYARNFPVIDMHGTASPTSQYATLQVDKYTADLQTLHAGLLNTEAEVDKMHLKFDDATAKETESIKIMAQAQIDAWRKVAQDTPEYAKEAADAIATIQKNTTAQIAALGSEAQKRQLEFADQFAATFESRGVEALISGNLRAGIRGLAQDFAELIIRLTILRPLAESVATALSGASGGGGGFFSTIFGSLFGAHGAGAAGAVAGASFLAGGGSMSAGDMAVVGEKGPELWVPDHAGKILNQSQVAARGGGVTNVNQYISVTADEPTIETRMAIATRVAASAAYEAVMNNLNGRQ